MTPPEFKALLRQIEGSNCQSCSLSARRKRIVTHRGSLTARLYWQGEAPGKEEEAKGVPFCGPAGQLLINELDNIGLSLDGDFFVSNSVLCRPHPDPADKSKKENRAPKQEEIEACRTNVDNIIYALCPQLIIACGLPAFRAISSIPVKSLSEAVGKFFPPSAHRFDGVDADLFVIYHPSYVLRNPSAKTTFIHQLLQIRDYAVGRGII